METLELEEALIAARHGFAFTCDWRMTAHLSVLYRELISDKDGDENMYNEDAWTRTRNGIEALRSTRRMRVALMKSDMCPTNWNIDMMLYIVSCLILGRRMPGHVKELLYYRNSCLLHDEDVKLYTSKRIPFTGCINASDLNSSQLRVCVLVLSDSMSHAIDWQSLASWSTYQLLEVRLAKLVVDAIQKNSTDMAPDPVNFAACAFVSHAAITTAAARARRAVAVRATKALWHEHTFSECVARFPMEHCVDERVLQMAQNFGKQLACLFCEYAGEEQAACLDHAMAMECARCTDREFASYCINGGRAPIDRYAAFTALWPPSVIAALSGQAYMETFSCENDIQCLKIADNYLSTVMRLQDKNTDSAYISWLQGVVLLEDDWITRCPGLLSLPWHPPIIVQMGGSIGWVVLFWDETEHVRARTTTLSSDNIRHNSKISDLLICIVLWAQLRIELAHSRAHIAQENNNLSDIINRTAS